MLRRAAERLKANPQDPAAHLEYQLVLFLNGASVPQIEALAGLAPEDRNWLIAFLDGIMNLRSALRNDGGNAMVSRRIWPLLEMAMRLRAQAELTLPTLALCTKVSGFGVYEPMPNRFRGGSDHRVIVYCEVENFSSKQVEQQRWETRLSLEVVIYTLDGVQIWSDGKSSVVDVSRKQRHDFFVIKHMTLPRTLGLGKYILKITVLDEQAQRVAENNLEITMAAQ